MEEYKPNCEPCRDRGCDSCVSTFEVVVRVEEVHVYEKVLMIQATSKQDAMDEALDQANNGEFDLDEPSYIDVVDVAVVQVDGEGVDPDEE